MGRHRSRHWLMQTEIEAKFLAIDPARLRKILHQQGGLLKASERIMRRRNYDFPDLHLEKVGGWVRVRDEGDRITLSYKQLNDRTLHGTKEVNLTIDSFEAAVAFLEAIGLKQQSYQETKRESWILDGVEVEIDTWPWIPSFVELEGQSEAKLKSVAVKLDLDWSKALHGSVETAYMRDYDVTEAEIQHWSEIMFTPVPAWLEIKRRKAAQ